MIYFNLMQLFQILFSEIMSIFFKIAFQYIEEFS